MQLLTGEKILLQHYIAQPRNVQLRILRQAELDPKVSGPLIKAYRLALHNTDSATPLKMTK